MLYDPSRLSNAGRDILSADHWRRSGRTLATPAGRGTAIFIERGDGEPAWVLRHYRRGGLIAKFSLDRYLWRGEELTRPFQEYRLLADLHASGLPVPIPVAAGYERRGLTYGGDLLTERIPNAQPVSSLLKVKPLPSALYAAIGHCIRRFHGAGVYHADLNAHNILVLDDAVVNTSHERIFLIDFDRGRRQVPGRWQSDNLERLHRSLDKITRNLPAGRFTVGDWQALLSGYTS